LPDYLHEPAMFPKGRHGDQVDAAAQAFAYIGKPTGGEGILAFMRLELLQPFGLGPDDLTIVFDHEHKGTVFTAPSGCDVQREPDGFYHVAPPEWEAIRWHYGVTLIEDLNTRCSVE
jgi:hypothetical protein